MAKKSTMMMPLAIIVIGGGIGFWWWNSKDKTPVGLVVVTAMEGSREFGVNADGKSMTAGAVEGTWREDENSMSVASESAEKPLLVIYEEGTPIHAEVITLADYDFDAEPEECEDELDESEACRDAIIKASNEVMERWRKLAKEHGATEESIDEMFPIEEESTAQEAESIFGPMATLQSHFVW